MHIIRQSDLKTKNAIPYFEIPGMAKIGWLRHAFLTRRGGVSLPPYDSLNLSENYGDRNETVSQNRRLVATAFGFDPSRLILLNQIHQDRILLMREPLRTPSPLLEYDGLITNVPNTFLGILTADCLPIFVVDPKKKVVGAIHAGRQGTALRITAKVLKKMKEEFGGLSQDLLIGLGPSIGPCCYEIDERVFDSDWEPFSTLQGGGKWRVDLTRINIDSMEKEGIDGQQIFRIDLCTSCHPDLFFSYRIEGQTGRQLSFIGIV